jgi:hypothetical protein
LQKNNFHDDAGTWPIAYIPFGGGIQPIEAAIQAAAHCRSAFFAVSSLEESDDASTSKQRRP